MKDKWWKYILAVLASIILFLVVGFLTPLLLNLLNLFIPVAYQYTEGWISVLSVVFAVYAALEIVDKIVPNSKMFSVGMSAFFALYLVGVGVWNFSLGATTPLKLLSNVIGSVTAIYYLVKFVREDKK